MLKLWLRWRWSGVFNRGIRISEYIFCWKKRMTTILKILELLMSLILTRQNWNWPQIVFATKNSRKCDRLFCRCWPSAGCAAVCMRLCISRSCAEWGDAASADCTPRRSQAAVTRCPSAGLSKYPLLQLLHLNSLVDACHSRKLRWSKKMWFRMTVNGFKVFPSITCSW